MKPHEVIKCLEKIFDNEFEYITFGNEIQFSNYGFNGYISYYFYLDKSGNVSNVVDYDKPTGYDYDYFSDVIETILKLEKL